MVRKSIVVLLTAGLLLANPLVYSQTIESGGNSAEDSLLGGVNKAKQKSTPAGVSPKSKSSKSKSASKKKKSNTKVKNAGPKIDTVSVDNIMLKLNSCSSSNGNLNCKGIVNAVEGTNFSLQCYSGSYLVADGREVGCQSVRISDVKSWSYVAVGLSPNQAIPFEISFSNAGSSLASAINLVVSTPSKRNSTLSFKNISIR